MNDIKRKLREELLKEESRTKHLTESLKPLSDISDELFFYLSIKFEDLSGIKV